MKSKNKIGMGFVAPIRSGVIARSILLRQSAILPIQTIWNFSLPFDTNITGSKGSVDYFAKFRFLNTENRWVEWDGQGFEPDNRVWVVDENPPVFWIFFPSNALRFKFDLHQSNNNWDKLTLIATSGWQRSPIWYLESPVADNARYLLEVKCETVNHLVFQATKNYQREIRVFVPPNTPVSQKIKSNTLKTYFESTYPIRSVSANRSRHSLFGWRIQTLRDKYNQANSNYEIKHAIDRIIQDWHSTTSRYGSTQTAQRISNQQQLEQIYDQTNNQIPSIWEPDYPNVQPRYIFNLGLPSTQFPSILGGGNGDDPYQGYQTLLEYFTYLLAVAVFHPNNTERGIAYQYLRDYLKTLVERAWVQTPGGALRSNTHPLGNPDNLSHLLWAVALAYDMLYEEHIANDTTTFTLFGQNLPVREAIAVFMERFIVQNYFPSEYYQVLSEPTNREYAMAIKPFESHKHRNHYIFLLVMLVLNRFMGWEEFANRIQIELDKLYATQMPWALHDTGYNEGCSYLASYLSTRSRIYPILQAIGIPCHQLRYIGKVLLDLIYAAPYPTHEWCFGDSSYMRPFPFDPDNSSIKATALVASHFFAGTTTNPGAPESQLFLSYILQDNYQNVLKPSQNSALRHLTPVLFAMTMIPSFNADEYIETTSFATRPLSELNDFMVSRVTKFAYVPTDVKTNQEDDTLTGKPKINVAFCGQRLLRQSHMRNSPNDLKIAAGGEFLIGPALWGYTYHSSTSFSKLWAESAIGYTCPLILPEGAGDWGWSTTFNGQLVRESYGRVSGRPILSQTELLTSSGDFTYQSQLISRWVYLENSDKGASKRLRYASEFTRRVVILPDFPLIVVLDEVVPSVNGAILWSWYGWRYLRDEDPQYNSMEFLVDRNRSPFFGENPSQLTWRLESCRAGNNYRNFEDPTHIGHIPRMAARIGALPPSPNPHAVSLHGKVYRPYQTNTIYRMPTWDANEYRVSGGDVRYIASVPHPLAFWTAINNMSSQDMNDNIGYVPAGERYRVVFWFVPYRRRDKETATLIPNVDANNDWIALRQDDRAPNEIQIGVFNNAATAKYGVIVKFRKSGYTETNAVSLEYIPNQSAWDSFTNMQPG